ncbi:UNVERIFIED_CONTAM: hypothetical protein HDU68_011272 [Siphonaria sp. JEL0065]|nr:hypothetical protein HDU68_011272 [Siphonaria sp. JEL0065]
MVPMFVSDDCESPRELSDAGAVDVVCGGWDCIVVENSSMDSEDGSISISEYGVDVGVGEEAQETDMHEVADVNEAGHGPLGMKLPDVAEQMLPAAKSKEAVKFAGSNTSFSMDAVSTYNVSESVPSLFWIPVNEELNKDMSIFCSFCFDFDNYI